VAYSVELSIRASNSLRRLRDPIRSRIEAALDALSTTPRPPGVRKLAGSDNAWRIRVGDYRVVYEIYDQRLVIVVIDLGHRASIYE